MRGVVAALVSAGLPPAIVTGGGTGSHRIDAAMGLFTEIQPGSYLFMDSCYGAISISENDNPFAPSLFVAATVVSANKPGRVVVNAGWKAFATDSGKPVALRGAPPGAAFRFMGDEHGALDFEGDGGPALGSIIEFLTSGRDACAAHHLHGRGSLMIAGVPVNLPQTAAAKQNPRQKPLVITIAADAKYYIRNEARLISQDLMRRSTMQTINTSAV